MQEGTIARLVSDRGFGFISRQGEEKDLFFHSSDVKNAEFNSLKEGDKVTFELGEGPKGPAATNVNVA
jgi:cold shock protein